MEACPTSLSLIPKFLCITELRNALVLCSSFSLVFVSWLSCYGVVVKRGFVTTYAAFTFTPRDTVKLSARDWGMGR